MAGGSSFALGDTEREEESQLQGTVPVRLQVGLRCPVSMSRAELTTSPPPLTPTTPPSSDCVPLDMFRRTDRAILARVRYRRECGVTGRKGCIQNRPLFYLCPALCHESPLPRRAGCMWIPFSTPAKLALRSQPCHLSGAVLLPGPGVHAASRQTPAPVSGPRGPRGFHCSEADVQERGISQGGHRGWRGEGGQSTDT